MTLPSFLILTLFAHYVIGYSGYPGTCIPSQMNQGVHTAPTAPDPAGKISLSDANGNSLTKYIGGGSHTITFTNGGQIGGFFMFVTNGNGTYVGSFSAGQGQTTFDTLVTAGTLSSSLALPCPGKTALGHTSATNTNSISGKWVADGGASGNLSINFVYVNSGDGAVTFINSAVFAQEPGTTTPPATPVTPSVAAPVQQNASPVGTTLSLSVGAIAGIVAGSVFVILLILAIAAPILYSRIKRDEPHSDVYAFKE